jgi:hypothetical protein
MDAKKHAAFSGSVVTMSNAVNGKLRVFDGYCHGHNVELIDGKKRLYRRGISLKMGGQMIISQPARFCLNLLGGKRSLFSYRRVCRSIRWKLLKKVGNNTTGDR